MRRIILTIVFTILGIALFSASQVSAANNGNSYGYAWSEGIGWISFDGTGSTTATYGITTAIDGLSGYAWAENGGWIKASGTCAEAGGCPGGGDTYRVTATTTCSVGVLCLDGYAWGEGVGWISFATSSTNYSNDSTSTYGVYIDSNGTFQGYAWGDQIGWINMSGTCAEAGGCPGGLDDYAVINTEFLASSEYISIVDPDSGENTDFCFVL